MLFSVEVFAYPAIDSKAVRYDHTGTKKIWWSRTKGWLHSRLFTFGCLANFRGLLLQLLKFYQEQLVWCVCMFRGDRIYKEGSEIGKDAISVARWVSVN